MPITVTTGDAESITGGGATLYGSVDASDNVSSCGFFWSIEHELPNSTDNVLTSTMGDLLWSGEIDGLYFGALVYFRAWAQDSVDGLVLGEIKSFRTLSVPSLRTTAPVVTGATTATCGGTFLFGGGSAIAARSVLLKIGAVPTISDYDIKVDAVPGSGAPEAFDVAITGLTAGATYQVRARALNTSGNGYGNVHLFKTGVGIMQIPHGKDSGTGLGLGFV